MDHVYIPILRWKRGERIALQRLTEIARTDVTPLLLLGPQQYVGRAATKTAPAVVAANVFCSQMKSVWGGREFYLDASGLPDGVGPHPIAEIAASARDAGLKLIPATRLIASPNYRAAVKLIDQFDKRGVGLSVDLSQFTSALQWVSNWEHTLEQTDLIADFAGNVGTVASLGASLIHAFTSLYGGVKWRSVTSAGTSMPDNFSGLGEGLYKIERAEWKLWSDLRASGLPYTLNYGDYATVPVVPAPEGIAWGFPINVRYTLSDDFLICRG